METGGGYLHINAAYGLNYSFSSCVGLPTSVTGSSTTGRTGAGQKRKMYRYESENSLEQWGHP